MTVEERVLRAVHAAEFLLALLAVYTLWSQVGGQNHLDLIDWPWKLLLGAGLALAGVMAWNRKSAVWMILAVLLAVSMGALTYYHHLNEQTEEEPEVTVEQT